MVDLEFPKKVLNSDFLVASENMGYCHDHELACMSIREAWIGTVICDPTNASFFRNCFAHRMAIFSIPGHLRNIGPQDRLEIDLLAGPLKNLTADEEITFTPVPVFQVQQVSQMTCILTWLIT